MKWHSLFNAVVAARVQRVKGEPRLSSAEEGSAKGVFITPQSLVTFPIATTVISIIWKVLGTLFPSIDGSLWIPACTSLMFGAFIFYVGISDPKAKTTRRDVIIGAVVAVVNSFYLFASSVGIVSVAGSGGEV